MILELRDFIKREGLVSSQQLSREFHLDETALNPMLDIWLRKGVIKTCQSQASCTKCTGCKKPPTYYQMA